MARSGKKQLEAAEQLRMAAEAGDPAAMWNYALFRLNMQPPAGSNQIALPFLTRVEPAEIHDPLHVRSPGCGCEDLSDLVSLHTDVVVQDDRAIREFKVRPMGFRATLELALTR
jgi:hypothetical protein